MLLSILIIGTVAVVAGAGTWAQFTAIATSDDNTFTAGQMSISTSTTFAQENIYPSQSFLTSPAITIANDEASPDAIRQIALNLTAIDGDTDKPISTYINVDNVTITPADGEAVTVEVNDLLTDLSNPSIIIVPVTLPIGTDASVVFGCTFLEDAPDSCQGASNNVDITFVGSQFQEPVE